MKIIVLSSLLVFGISACSGGEKIEPVEKKEAVVVPAKETPKKEVMKEAVEPKKTAAHWSYTGAFGPQFWGNLEEKYSACKSGKEQSPINLVWKAPKSKGSELSLAYKETKMSVVDNGHTVQFNIDAGSSMIHNGKTYDLKHFDFHSPSEHQLSGKSFPMEMHLIHNNADGDTSILGVLFKEGKENPMFKKLFDKIPAEKNKMMEDPSFVYTASVLLPALLHHYSYQGSLTTPPCTEKVSWLLLNTPVELSKAQIDKFKSLYSGNNRPVQALNSREYSNF